MRLGELGARVGALARLAPPGLEVLQQVIGRIDADVAGEQRRLELLERLGVELAAAEHAGQGAGELLARQPEAGLEPIGPGALRRRRLGLGELRAHRFRRQEASGGDGSSADLAAGEASAGGFFLKKSNNGAPRNAAGEGNAGEARILPVPSTRLPVPPSTAQRVRVIGGRFRGRVIRFPQGAERAAHSRPRPRDAVQLAGPGLGRAVDARPLRGQRRALAGSAVTRRGAGGGHRSRSRARPGDRRHRARRSARRDSRPTRPTPVPGSPTTAAATTSIFLDPPFGDDPWPWLLPACAARLAAGGYLYAEAARALTPPPG